MDQYTAFANAREHLGVSQQTIADIAGVDVAMVEKYENGELSPDPRRYELLIAHEKIGRALFTVLARVRPEKVEAAVQPVLELAKTYPEGSQMQNFLNSARNFLRL